MDALPYIVKSWHLNTNLLESSIFELAKFQNSLVIIIAQITLVPKPNKSKMKAGQTKKTTTDPNNRKTFEPTFL